MFNDLIDLRLIHIVKKQETHKKFTGKLFEAYILDMGSYATQLRLRQKIEEIDIFMKYGIKGDSPFRFKVPSIDINQFKKNVT
jgi:hypothetical protein